jgi:hypothetical protein
MNPFHSPSASTRDLKGNKPTFHSPSLEGPMMTLVYSAFSGNFRHARPSNSHLSSLTVQDSTPPGASTHSSMATKESMM